MKVLVIQPERTDIFYRLTKGAVHIHQVGFQGRGGGTPLDLELIAVTLTEPGLRIATVQGFQRTLFVGKHVRGTRMPGLASA